MIWLREREREREIVPFLKNVMVSDEFNSDFSFKSVLKVCLHVVKFIMFKILCTMNLK